jgi:methylornithine synthase
MQPGETPGFPAKERIKMSIILQKALDGQQLNKSEVLMLLASEEDQESALYEAAREMRTRHFDDRIYLYGFVYFSTHCRNNCNFCYYRKSNQIYRYRKEPDEVLAIAEQLAESGVHLLDLTMGEDPVYHEKEFSPVLSIISKIKEATGLPVMISPGVVPHKIIDEFAKREVEWYALYQETYNRDLFAKLRLDQEYDKRMDAKLYARSRGMLIEEGLMTGIGETLEDLADSILAMSRIDARQLRVMSFVPQQGIPMEQVKTPDRGLESKTIAILRLLNPKSLIPASLDVDGIAGLTSRIDAGANVVTSIIPPNSGFAGVAQNSMDIDDGSRTVKGVETILSTMGLRVGTQSEYQREIKA